MRPASAHGTAAASSVVGVGAGANGLAQPANFRTNYSPNSVTTGEGSTAMGFYNVQKGDVPYFKHLADEYSTSDNFHQSVNGGTGPIDPHCLAGRYYLLNNYNPGYFGNGKNAYTDTNPNNTVFTISPSSVRSIGDEMIAKYVSWKYYGDQWNNYVPDPYQLNYGAIGKKTDEYCTICNPFQYDTSIMANASVRDAHIQDTTNLYEDIARGTLPAVSFVKPSGLVDGHPASSKLDLFEGFTKKIVEAVKSNPKLWKDTAIFITFDEGGGYYDFGYVQPLNCFGGGTRILLIVVSAYSTEDTSRTCTPIMCRS